MGSTPSGHIARRACLNSFARDWQARRDEVSGVMSKQALIESAKRYDRFIKWNGLGSKNQETDPQCSIRRLPDSSRTTTNILTAHWRSNLCRDSHYSPQEQSCTVENDWRATSR